MKTCIFIDAANLLYGFDKEYGWQIDYNRFKKYFLEKYNAKDVLYFGGIDVKLDIYQKDEFNHDYSSNNTVDLIRYIKHFENLLMVYELSVSQIALANKYIQQAKFYRKLESFGYKLYIKPVKRYRNSEFEISRRKANCDVDLTLEAIDMMNYYDRAVVVSGDGDFLPLYKYLEKKGKEVYILSRSSRVAKEVTMHLGTKFLEIRKLKNQIEFLRK